MELELNPLKINMYLIVRDRETTVQVDRSLGTKLGGNCFHRRPGNKFQEFH